MNQSDSFKTNTITDKFKRTFIRVANLDEFKRAQELMFQMGFRWIYESESKRTVKDYKSFYLYVNGDNQIQHSPDFVGHGEVAGFKEITFYDLCQAADEVKAIRKARKKDSKRRKKLARIMKANGYVKNTGTKPEGDVEAVLFRNGTIRVMSGYNDPSYEYPYSYNPDMTVEYYKPVKKTVTLQEMVQGIVEDAGGKEVVAVPATSVDKDGWITWNGGKCPVSEDACIEIKFRNDTEVYPVKGAGMMRWDHLANAGDIVAYRLCPTVTTAKEPVASLGACQVGIPVGEQPDTNPKRQFGVASIPLNLWSPLASAYGAVSLYNGSLKYGRGNYRATPVEASVYIAAAMRHLLSWAEGEEFDPADGCPNLGGVLANIAILLDARACGTLIDDRQIPSGYLKEREMLKALVVKLQELHAGKDPRHYTIADVK